MESHRRVGGKSKEGREFPAESTVVCATDQRGQRYWNCEKNNPVRLA
jgi:hypothetical protein